MSAYPLVSTAWLHEHLHDSNVRIVDIRGHIIPASEPPPHYFSHHAEYAQSHLPNAVFVDWTQDIVAPHSISLDVAPPTQYAELMSRLGIGDETMVVAYDDCQSLFAARLWWTLLYYGHSQVAVLDGGWQKWIAEARPVTADLPSITPQVFTPRPNPAIYRDATAILTQLEQPQLQLIDTRTAAEFLGESSRAKRFGHIPGAVNVPRHDLIAPDGTLKPADALRAVFNDAGIRLDHDETVVYCNAGVSASYTLMALRVAGLTIGSVYDGSWKDWGNDPQKPIV